MAKSGAAASCSLITDLAVALQQCSEERNVKRHFANQLMYLVVAGRNVAALQPASYSKTHDEARLWEKFYAANSAEECVRGSACDRCGHVGCNTKRHA